MRLRFHFTVIRIKGRAWNHTNVQNGIRDTMGDLEKSDITLLFIHGEKDYLPSNPENTKILANHLSNADVFILANGGHMFFSKQLWDILFNRITMHIDSLNMDNSADKKSRTNNFPRNNKKYKSV